MSYVRSQFEGTVKSIVNPLKPRIVLALLLVASGAGRWLTARGQGTGIGGFLAEWAVLGGIAVLVGGVGWWLSLWSQGETSESRCNEFVEHRFRLMLLLGAAMFASASVLSYVSTPTETALARVIVSAAAVTFVLGASRDDVISRYLYTGVIGLGVAGLATTVAGNVFDPFSIDALVRFGHLLAFVVWLGGALWHNAIIVAAIRRFPQAKTALKAQSEGFRPAVLTIIGVLFLTGLYQATTLLGTSISTYTNTTFGALVLMKVATLTILTFLATGK